MKGRWWKVLKKVAGSFGPDEVMGRAAALAFYTALGLAPMILLFLTVASFLGEGTQDRLIDQIESLAGASSGSVVPGAGAGGETLAEGIDQVVENAKKKEKGSGVVAAIITGVTLLFSASAVFAQLQTSLNKIWDVRVRPDTGVWMWVRSRLLSMGMVIAILFLLLVSLVVSAVLAMFMPDIGGGWQVVNAIVSVLVFTSLFSIIFKYLPDVVIRWRDVALGAFLTAILFALGKYGIGMYIGNLSLSSSYGAAGSFLAVLIWVYYSSIIVFVGAEITEAVTDEFGPGILPSSHAERCNPAAKGECPEVAQS